MSCIGSCWVFSTIVAVEGINQIKTNKLVALSEQELVDCDTQENQGCNGGLMEYAFEYIKQKNGLTTYYYPYTANDGSCDASKENAPAISMDGHETVPANDEDAFLKFVANQPVSVAKDAGGSDFQFYSEGGTVRASEAILRGTFVCEYIGEILGEHAGADLKGVPGVPKNTQTSWS